METAQCGYFKSFSSMEIKQPRTKRFAEKPAHPLRFGVETNHDRQYPDLGAEEVVLAKLPIIDVDRTQH